MIRIRTASLLVLTGLIATGAALAQTAPAGGDPTADKPATTVSGSGEATTEAGTQADLDGLRKGMAARAAHVPVKAQARAESELNALSHDADHAVDTQGAQKVAGRLAMDFGTTTDAIMQEHTTLNASWGNLMIAHTLAANATNGVTVAQLIAMHQSGMGWGQIAAGLGFNLGSVISGVKAESRVATGHSKPNGQVAVIHGEGARAGVKASAGMKTGMDARGMKGGVGAGAGAGLGIKVGH